MDLKQYEEATALFTCLLSRLLPPPSLEEKLITKYTYLLFSGVETVDHEGNLLQLYPVGPHLSWFLEFLTGKSKNKIFFAGDKNPIAECRFTGENVHFLLEAVSHDPIALEAAKELIHLLREQKREIPSALSDLAIDHFTGKIKRQYRKNRMPNFHRDLCIIMCISALAKKFKPISKNSREYTSVLCLCGAMQAALKIHQIHLDYQTIITIWKNRKSRQTFVDRFPIEILPGRKISIGALFNPGNDTLNI